MTALGPAAHRSTALPGGSAVPARRGRRRRPGGPRPRPPAGDAGRRGTEPDPTAAAPRGPRSPTPPRRAPGPAGASLASSVTDALLPLHTPLLGVVETGCRITRQRSVIGAPLRKGLLHPLPLGVAIAKVVVAPA